MAFELPPLPYDYSALEPTIDAATMKLRLLFEAPRDLAIRRRSGRQVGS